MPARRHDNKEWHVSDEERMQAAGKQITKAAVIFLKADWMEFPATFGSPSFNDKMRPCRCCNATRASMHLTEGLSVLQLLT
eukprot:4292341-Karenia_brevis.AAC.1